MAKATSKSSAKNKKPAPAKAKKAAAPAPKKVAAAKPAEKPSKAEKPTAKAVSVVAAKKDQDRKELDRKTAAPSTPVVKQTAVGKPAPAKTPAKPTAPVKAASSEDDEEENEPSKGASSHDDDDGDDKQPVRPVMSTAEVFSPEDLEMFRQLLADERKKLLHKAKIAMESGNIALNKDEMMDEVDLASATVEQNLTFRLLDRDRKLLGEIEHAMEKLDNGEYGFCEGTGEVIPKRRLELRPWTRHSVKYKEQLERMKKSGRGVADEDEAW